MQIRAPAVAGSFYPADRAELESVLAGLMSHAGAAALESGARSLPKALIVPHAGYIYSGPVAASAYARLAAVRERVQRVVLLGPAHRVAFRGIAAPECDALETPLGAVRVDRDALRQLEDLPCFGSSDRVHADEHSLEVQLPFLQWTLGEFSLVPLVVGDAEDTEVADVLNRLWGGDETLLVVSSDLSHYHDYVTARRMDEATCASIETLAPDALDGESACGCIPVRGLLRASRAHGLVVQTLDLRSSGDTAGDRRRVVGYGAWALAARETAGDTKSEEEDRLLAVARQSIVHGLEHGAPPVIDTGALSGSLERLGACFVTLRSPEGTLRGCIGSLEPRRSLAEDVAQNAFAAAFRDPRMPPVSWSELEALRIELSLLGPLEPIPAGSLADVVRALRPGRDGLLLEDGAQTGTLLPQVWSEVPEPREFAGIVWRKAGLPADHWSPGARAFRYRVRKIEAA